MLNTSETHPTITRIAAIEVQNEKRVIGVEWGQHDILLCDGNHLDIDTEEFLRCPVSGCLWSYDSEFTCPEHQQGV